METKYKEVIIEYIENKDVWCSNYLGFKHISDSLVDAKRYVDSVIGKKQYGKKAYLPLYSGFTTVMIVSELNKSDCCHVQYQDGNTNSIYAEDLFVINNKNTKSINEIIKLQRKIFELSEKKQTLYSELKKVF